MKVYEERDLALKLFASLLDVNPEFAYALENYCYDNIIRIAPPESHDILSEAELGLYPAKWAYMLIYYGRKGSDWVWPVIATSPEYSYLSLEYFSKLIPTNHLAAIKAAAAQY